MPSGPAFTIGRVLSLSRQQKMGLRQYTRQRMVLPPVMESDFCYWEKSQKGLQFHKGTLKVAKKLGEHYIP